MKTARAVGTAALALALGACAGSTTGGGGATAAAAGAPESDAAARFGAAEDRVLALLAASDPRLAARLPVPPEDGEAGRAALQQLVGGDESAALDGSGSVDVFAFGARRRLVAAAQAELARAPTALPEAARAERELLARLIDDEGERIVREGTPGRATAALLGSLADGWSPPRNEADARARGQALARRLDELREGLGKVTLSPFERDAIDDALDPLEHRAMDAGLHEAAARIAALRVELGASRTAPSKATPAADLGRALRVALGEPRPATELQAALVGAKTTLARAVAAGLAGRTKDDQRFVLEQAAALARDPATCPRPTPGSRLRAAGPPAERVGMRGIACILHATRSERTAHLAALTAAHDLVVVGLWAVEVHGRGTDPYQAETAHRLLGAAPPEWAARRLRAAVADPAAAIGAGMAVAWLAREGVEHVAERAAAWVAFGDAPLDLVARALRAPSTAP